MADSEVRNPNGLLRTRRRAFALEIKDWHLKRDDANSQPLKDRPDVQDAVMTAYDALIRTFKDSNPRNDMSGADTGLDYLIARQVATLWRNLERLPDFDMDLARTYIGSVIGNAVRDFKDSRNINMRVSHELVGREYIAALNRERASPAVTSGQQSPQTPRR